MNAHPMKLLELKHTTALVANTLSCKCYCLPHSRVKHHISITYVPKLTLSYIIYFLKEGMLTKFAHFVEWLERLEFPKHDDTLLLDFQFCLHVNSLTHIRCFPAVSLIISDCLATKHKQPTRHWLANIILLIQQTVLSTMQAELAKTCFSWIFQHKNFTCHVSANNTAVFTDQCWSHSV